MGENMNNLYNIYQTNCWNHNFPNCPLLSALTIMLRSWSDPVDPLVAMEESLWLPRLGSLAEPWCNGSTQEITFVVNSRIISHHLAISHHRPLHPWNCPQNCKRHDEQRCLVQVLSVSDSSLRQVQKDQRCKSWHHAMTTFDMNHINQTSIKAYFWVSRSPGWTVQIWAKNTGHRQRLARKWAWDEGWLGWSASVASRSTQLLKVQLLQKTAHVVGHLRWVVREVQCMISSLDHSLSAYP